MWYLIKIYHQFELGEKAIIEPSEVNLKTSEYQSDTNYYYDFINDTIEKVEDEEAKVSIPFLYDRFKEFYEQGGYPGKPPARKEMINFFKNKEMVIANNSLYGYKKKDLNEA